LSGTHGIIFDSRFQQLDSTAQQTPVERAAHVKSDASLFIAVVSLSFRYLPQLSAAGQL
jgi:hypothetical protein